MAWPRMKNSRSSAEPGIHPRDGVQATVTPAPDADPPPGSGQNTGVNGTMHAVAQNPAASRPGPGGPRAGRPARPIRYAHAEVGEPDSAAASTGRADEPEPLSGIVLPPAAPASPRPAESPRPPRDEPADHDEHRKVPANEGLGIFRGVTTTEVTDDAPAKDAGHQPRFLPQRGAAPAAKPETSRTVAVGAAWNQPITPPPVPSGPAEEDKPAPFGRVLGFLRGGAAAVDDQPRVSVRDLPPDVQVHFWRMRAILMVVVGAAFFALTRSWEIALTLAILAGIVDTVRRSRSAALYVNGAKHPGAQKQTRSQLNKLRRDGYFALDARPIPNSREVIDHLVVGPTGVYAIDSEKWDPRLPIRTLNAKRLYLGPESQKERLEHAVWEASQASEILSAALGYHVAVRPALAIYGPKVPWDIATIRNVDVFTGPALGKYLKQRYRMRGRPSEGVPSLTREEIRTIYDTAARMLPDVAPSMTSTPVG
jgi:hypothetical protein